MLNGDLNSDALAVPPETFFLTSPCMPVQLLAHGCGDYLWWWVLWTREPPEWVVQMRGGCACRGGLVERDDGVSSSR